MSGLTRNACNCLSWTVMNAECCSLVSAWQLCKHSQKVGEFVRSSPRDHNVLQPKLLLIANARWCGSRNTMRKVVGVTAMRRKGGSGVGVLANAGCMHADILEYLAPVTVSKD
eukprot:3343170-Pleurochrysis_carterae.AAC.2